MNIEGLKKIHFIGIGGIMMSALARYAFELGIEVTGSDRSESEITDELKKEGVHIKIGHSADNIASNYDLVVYTVAIGDDNPELKQAHKLGLNIKKVYQVLGEIADSMFNIAISGMHGKSTTTAMTALTLEHAHLDPTVFIGTKIKEWGSNFRFGHSKYFLTEACEYKDNFLEYKPNILVINNIEAEHLDYFKDIEGVKRSFAQFISQIKDGGTLIYNADNELASELAAKFDGKKLSFGIENGDVKAQELEEEKGNFSFKVDDQKFKLSIAGKYNVYNALATLAVARTLKIEPEGVSDTLEKFVGAWRRMEFKGKRDGVEYFDDYAHHPTEIKFALEAASKKFAGKKLFVVYQPHLYSRTYDFFDQFATELAHAENLVLIPIYPAREENKWDVSSEKLVRKINDSRKHNYSVFAPDFESAAKYLLKKLKPGDVVLTMGAGEAFRVGEILLNL